MLLFIRSSRYPGGDLLTGNPTSMRTAEVAPTAGALEPTPLTVFVQPSIMVGLIDGIRFRTRSNSKIGEHFMEIIQIHETIGMSALRN